MDKELLKQQIKEAKANLAKMEEELNKPDKWEWNYEELVTYRLSGSDIIQTFSGNSKKYLEHGRYRRTKEQAEHSLLRNKRANRLEALVYELQEKVGGKHYVYEQEGTWTKSTICFNVHPGVVLMKKSTAIKICNMLNNGKFSLEGEL